MFTIYFTSFVFICTWCKKISAEHLDRALCLSVRTPHHHDHLIIFL